MPPMPVETITLANKPVEQVSEFISSLKSRRSSTIQPQAEGHLTRIAVRSGVGVVMACPVRAVVRREYRRWCAVSLPGTDAAPPVPQDRPKVAVATVHARA